MATPTAQIVGELSRRLNLVLAGDPIAQTHAWAIQIDILKRRLTELGAAAEHWGVLLELPLLRLGRRLDGVILIGGAVVVVEFKIGSDSFGRADLEQAEDYALCLRDFHSGSAGRGIVPILCAEKAAAPPLPTELLVDDSVTQTLRVNGEGLADALRLVAGSPAAVGQQIDWRVFDRAAYNPTPTIIEAAQALYAGHTVRDIGRSDAAAEALAAAASRLQSIAADAKAAGGRTICCVTGTPGAGKTLLGLNLVFARGDEGATQEPAAMLSGNRPLTFVLQEALAQDSRTVRRRSSRTTTRPGGAAEPAGLPQGARSGDQRGAAGERDRLRRGSEGLGCRNRPAPAAAASV